jgi:2-isopropylmalate synthase
VEKVLIFDTTLRDGEQSPGASMSVREKAELAVQLERLGVDVIEAGFPVSSPAQMEGVEAVAASLTHAAVAALARAVKGDLDAAAKSLKQAKRGRIHTFIATSEIHMQHKLGKTPAQVLQMAVDSVRYAKDFAAEVEFSAEDASRSDHQFLAEITAAVIEAGAAIVNLPDTTGYALPNEYAEMFLDVRRLANVPPGVILSTHCHNDLGMALANSLAAVRAGARQIEVTINGIGERAGNAALEEAVMALITRRGSLMLDTGIQTKEIFRTSKLLSSITGQPISANKPIVGKNVFAHESGIHQDGVLKHRGTYEIMTPESIGRATGEIVLGRHSGKHGFAKKLSDLGYAPDADILEQAWRQFCALADKKKEVFDEDIAALFEDAMYANVPETYHVEYVNFTGGNTSIPTATVVMICAGERFQEAATGDGPVDAIYSAINRVIRIPDIKLEHYNLAAVTEGKDAQGEVSVRVSSGGKQYSGRATDTDIVLASCRAYVNALNRMQGAKKTE